jgi:hypothetical protein
MKISNILDHIDSGQRQAIFDLAWPNGIQEELSQPVAVLLNESTETITIASRAGFRCFTTAQDFKEYVQREILAEEIAADSETDVQA